MATVQELLNLAVRHHQAGELAQAEQIYRQVLQSDPRQVDAWHLLGVVAAQHGNHDSAIECMRYAIAIKPDEAAFHTNLGNSLLVTGRGDDALAAFQEGLRLKPDSAQA